MTALVGVIMGSKSDWSTLSHTADMLEKLGIPHEVTVVSAHRTPDLLFQYAEQAEARGLRVIIAGAGGAAHLPGMCAAKTHLPVLGVPVQSSMLSGELPAMIHLYRRPLLDEWAETGVSLEELVTHVIVHEAGHHFGFSDAEMHAIEDAAD